MAIEVDTQGQAAVIPQVILTKNDRSDCCGVVPLARVTRESMELLFCQHHLDKHKEALAGQGWVTQYADVSVPVP